MSICRECGRLLAPGTVGGFSLKDIDGGKNTEQQKSTFDAGYWKSTAGDCDKFKRASQSAASSGGKDWCKEQGGVGDDPCNDWCVKQGGTGNSPCLNLAHSCVSTVVCQVFNYIYANGAFAQQCGKYGKPVGNLIWYSSQFETTIVLAKELWEDLKCLGADTGSCWPDIEHVWYANVKIAQKVIESIVANRDKLRAMYGLPPAPPCIGLAYVRAAALVARGDVPSDDSPDIREALRKEIDWQYFQDSTPVARTGIALCPKRSISVEQALIELSLWADPNGFGQSLGTVKLVFLNQDNSVQGGSWPIKSRIRMLNEPAHALEWMHPEMLPPGLPPASFYTAPSAESTAGNPDSSPFNIHIVQEGGPETCKSISASNDSRLCSQVAGILLEDRMSALYRIVPYVVAAAAAEVIDEAIRTGSKIRWSTEPRTELDGAAPSPVSTAAKVAGVGGALGLLGVLAWKFGPALLGQFRR